MSFRKKNLKIKKINFILFHLIFVCYYGSIDFKRQSKFSRLRPDTSSLVLLLTKKRSEDKKRRFLLEEQSPK